MFPESVALLFNWNCLKMEQLQIRAYQRQGIDLLPRPTLDLLPENVTGIMLKELSKMEHFEL